MSFSAAVPSVFLLSLFGSPLYPFLTPAVSPLSFLASVYLFSHPRGHLIVLPCTANSLSVSTGYEEVLLTAGAPEVQCVQASFSITFSISAGSLLQQIHFMDSMHTLFHS